jgi:hypothetical protein
MRARSSRSLAGFCFCTGNNPGVFVEGPGEGIDTVSQLFYRIKQGTKPASRNYGTGSIFSRIIEKAAPVKMVATSKRCLTIETQHGNFENGTGSFFAII